GGAAAYRAPPALDRGQDPMNTNSSFPLAASAALMALASAALPAQDAAKQDGAKEPAKLRIVAIPDATSVKDDQEKFAKWLGSRVGAPVEFTSVPNYPAAVTALATGKAELGWLGGVTTVQAMNESKGKVLPLVTTENNLHFKSYVIANK